MPPQHNRFVHETTLTPEKDAEKYLRGQKHREVAAVSYHRLRAAVSGQFDLTQVPGDVSRGQFFSRSAILFDKYTESKLEPIIGLELRVREDGTIHPEYLKEYVRGLRASWAVRAGGAMHCVGMQAFWNIVLNYRSAAHTTGSTAWDALFARMLQRGFDRGAIPCMFFALDDGCLDPRCPFLHDRDACVRDREKVLAKRRVKLGRPTPRDVETLRQRAVPKDQNVFASVSRDVVDDDDEFDVDPGLEKFLEDLEKVKHVCARPQCVTAQLRKNASGDDGDITMKWCMRCKLVTYCSTECQKADWRRHMAEPCRPFEELVEDDESWDSFGERVHTTKYTMA